MRVELDGAVVVGNGAVGLALGAIGHAAVVIGERVVRIELDRQVSRLAMACVVVALVVIDVAQRIERVDIARVVV